MISLHRLNGNVITVNAELIESVESQGVQTVLGLVTGNRLIVTESVAEVIEKSLDYRKKVYGDGGPLLPAILRDVEKGGTAC